MIGVPTQAAYNASKFAVRGYSEALRQELELSGSPSAVPACIPAGSLRTSPATRAPTDPGATPDTQHERFIRHVRTSADDAARQILGPRSAASHGCCSAPMRDHRLDPAPVPGQLSALLSAASVTQCKIPTVSASLGRGQLADPDRRPDGHRASASPWCSRSSRRWAARWRWPRCRSPRSSPFRPWYSPWHRRPGAACRIASGASRSSDRAPRLHRRHGAVFLRVPRRPCRAGSAAGPLRRGARRALQPVRDHVGHQSRDHGLCCGPSPPPRSAPPPWPGSARPTASA
jgi:hypothetical protein